MTKVYNNKGDLAMPINKFMYWFDILRMNEKEKAIKSLEKASEKEKYCLLNGNFDYQECELDVSFNYGKNTCHKPLSVCLIYEAFDVFDVLLQHNAKVDQSDLNGNNVFHLLVDRTLMKPEEENISINIYHHLNSILSSTITRSLLLKENDFGFRPLEWAANNGILGLTKVMLLTNNVYVIREENKGLAKYQWIDVTEYESMAKNNRRMKSPLLSIMFLDWNRTNYLNTREFFSDEIFKTWFKFKMKCNILPAFILLLFRALFLAVFMIIDSDINYFKDHLKNGTVINEETVNESTSTATFCINYAALALTPAIRQTLTTYAVCYTLVSFLLDIYDVISNFSMRNIHLLKNARNEYKNIFVQYDFYRRVQFMSNIMIGTRGVLTMLNFSLNDEFVVYSRILIRGVAWWSTLFLTQLLPKASFFIIAVQSMLGILLQFSVMYGMFLFSYTAMFQMAINLNIKQGCATDFNDITTSLYSTFLAMLNMYDFSQYDFINPLPFYITHVCYVFLVSTLLLNFLIAIMSDRIKEVSRYKDVIIPIQQLSVLNGLELRLQKLCSFYYNWLQNRVYFIYNDRLCIVRIQFNSYNRPVM